MTNVAVPMAVAYYARLRAAVLVDVSGRCRVSQTDGEGAQEFVWQARDAVEHRVERAPADAQHRRLLAGRDGRRPRSAIEQGDLADDLARSEITDMMAVPGHLDPTVDDDQHLLAETILVDEHLPSLGVDLVDERRDTLELCGGQIGEQWDAPQPGDLLFASLQSHGRPPSSSWTAGCSPYTSEIIAKRDSNDARGRLHATSNCSPGPCTLPTSAVNCSDPRVVGGMDNVARTRDIDATTVVSAIVAGIVLAATNIIIDISIAALVFSGPLTPFVGAGIGYFLFGTLAVGLVVASTSAFPHAIAVAQDTPAVILAVAVAAVASALPAGTRAMLPTVVATMMATTLTAAVLFLLLGVFRLGNVVRYVPYPVIGGFLAGTGLLLVDGAVNVMSGIGVSASALPLLLHAETLVRWLPGLALAIVLLVVLRLSAHPLALPGLLLGATGVFHIVLWVSGIPAAAARASGWLLGPFPDEGLWQLPTVEFLRQARWDVIVAQSGTLATLLLIALLSFLLNATGLELAAQRDVELDHELKVVGVANVVSGVGGGPVGYHALGMSAAVPPDDAVWPPHRACGARWSASHCSVEPQRWRSCRLSCQVGCCSSWVSTSWRHGSTTLGRACREANTRSWW